MNGNSWLKATAGVCLAVSLITGCSSNSPSSAGGAAAGSAGSSGSGSAAGSGAWVDSADDIGGIQSGNLEGAAMALDNVYYFEFDTSELSLKVRARLDETASVMRSKSGLIRLDGHADERGTREYNLALGERRAKAVANYLAIQGVPNSQIEVISYGEEKPAAGGQGESAWAKNRRVELFYID